MSRWTSSHDASPDAHKAFWEHRKAYILGKSSAGPTLRSTVPRKKEQWDMRHGVSKVYATCPPPTSKPWRDHLLDENKIPPDVENTFFRWDGSGHAPEHAMQSGVRYFMAGRHIAVIPAESKAGLVQAVAKEILKGRVSSTEATLPQIQLLLEELHREMVVQNPDLQPLPREDSVWCVGTVRDRTKELEWLKHQASHRWWKLVEEEIDRQTQELSEGEVNAMFESYTHHSELASS